MIVASHSELARQAAEIRGSVIAMSHRARTAHLASSLSCVDILVAAYWGGALTVRPGAPDAEDRDRIILSKGHAVSALYATLARRGFFSEELLETYNANGSCLPEQPSPGCAPGVELATGSLGHGLPVALGLVLGGVIRRNPFRVLAIMSDGECNEGSVWEAAMMAPMHSTGGRLATVVDYNRWQATDRSENVMALAPLREKWAAFRWRVREVDGHDLAALVEALRWAYDEDPLPAAIVARTVKGKGVSFMEDDNNWHYRSPTADELAAARRELGLEARPSA